MPEPFSVTDCALIVIATGEKAYNLRDLHDRLLRMDDQAVMFFHFWDGLLRPDFMDPEFQNDFASWAYHDLHDLRLAEKLSILNPSKFSTMRQLRERVIEIIEDRMDEDDFDPRIDAENLFFFRRSQIVIFDTRKRIETPEDLGRFISHMSLGSVFYHFIDACRRTQSGHNDFTEWLWTWDEHHRRLADAIAAMDPYFKSLMEIREKLSGLFAKHLGQIDPPDNERKPTEQATSS
ncbi:MAG: DUF5752 family protein [Desulfobacterales bacterium]